MKISLKSLEKYFFTLEFVFSAMIQILFPTAVFLPPLILYAFALSLAAISFISIQAYTSIVLYIQKRE